jgi:simple sugar transport system permease protein
MPRLERRGAPSRVMAVASPAIALAVTALFGAALFAALGKDPLAGLRVFFVTPLDSARGVAEVGLKMTPLLLCSLGLALCYRANVWNIGAEGQFVAGTIAATGFALAVEAGASPAAWLGVAAAGLAGGTAWAALTAALRDRWNANEILVSLMLTYVAQLLLLYVVNGPWRDPGGMNFPVTRSFEAAAQIPRLVAPYRLNLGFVVALLAAAGLWLFLARSRAGLRLEVSGHAPLAARFAGFSSREGVWVSLLASGALAGLAGAFEVAGPLGQLTAQASTGYGFAAIIVAWLGRLSPLGCCFASFVMAMIVIGGELSQSRLGLPAAITNVFQGVLLLALLTADTFIHYRLRLR